MKPKQIAILVVIALFVIILVQNSERVDLQLLLWSYRDVPLVVVIISSIFVGFVTGWLAKLAFRRGKATKAKIARTDPDQIMEGTANNQPVSEAPPSTKARSQ
ncbi:LapA family protein [bacterium]|nr:LapA family protein [bacterium]